MQRNASIASEVDDRAALIASLTATVDTLTQQVAALTQQVEWFRRQLFGTKSERVVASDPQQMALGAVLPPVDGAPAPAGRPVAAHTRKAAQRDAAAESESLPFFDESKVPIIEIGLSTPEIEALSPDQYEVIGEKVSYRLAQQPGSYTVLKFTRPVIKRRQHQKLTDAGVRVSRPWLTQLTQQVIRLLMPIHEAQWASIRASRVIAMDETGIKAGRDGPGKMHQGYYWPVHGDREEICFIYANSRRHEVVEQVLGRERPPDRVLLSDGYAAYEAYARTKSASAPTSSAVRASARSGTTTPSRSWPRSSTGSIASSSARVCCHRTRSPKPWPTPASAVQGWKCSWPTPTCRSTPTIWNAGCARSRWVARTGCSAGPKSAPSRSASSRACW